MSQLSYAQLEVHREAIRRHCYRMTGSYYEAEDLVQETMLRAWRGLATLRDQAAPGSWLFRIATNLCLSWLRRKGRRQMPPELGPAAGSAAPGPRADELDWVTPYPTDLGPEAAVLADENIRLAFVVALQRLPARQRAVLLLREVLGWSALQTAQSLDTTVASVNSALQRARLTLRQADLAPLDSQPEPEVLNRYVSAWKNLDVEGLVALLSQDSTMVMPPYREWYRGPEEIRGLMTWAWARPGRGRGVSHMNPLGLNGQCGFAHFLDGRPHTLQVLDIRQELVRSIVLFHQPELFETFHQALRSD
ncbi:RNA polymerase subunit sigma-70 [bacterium]|nr:RNA polymerase subunit sigma-70 [bacterium]